MAEGLGRTAGVPRLSGAGRVREDQRCCSVRLASRSWGVRARSRDDGQDSRRSGLRSKAASLLIGLLVVLAVSVVWAESGVAEPVRTDHRGFLDLPSAERYVIEFSDGGTKLHIPRNYLTHWLPAEVSTGRPVFFIGMATFPGFRGATADNLRCFGNAGLLRCDTAIFSYAGPAMSPDPKRSWYLLRFHELVSKKFGLLGTPVGELHVYFGDGGWTVQVACSETVGTTCQMFFATAGADWRVQFRPSLFPQWRALAEGLRSLIDGFVVSEADRGGSP